MKKIFLIIFILLDLAAMAAASFFIYTTLQARMHRVTAPVRGMQPLQRPGTVPVAASVSLSTAATTVSTAAPVMVTPSTPYRNIGFTYKNSRARQVLIRADFTGWKGVPMKHDPNGIWSYHAQLTPGEYAYCFTVDDRIIKDPANKHTKRIAQTLVSAIMVEKAGTAKPVVEP